MRAYLDTNFTRYRLDKGGHQASVQLSTDPVDGVVTFDVFTGGVAPAYTILSIPLARLLRTVSEVISEAAVPRTSAGRPMPEDQKQTVRHALSVARAAYVEDVKEMRACANGAGLAEQFERQIAEVDEALPLFD